MRTAIAAPSSHQARGRRQSAWLGEQQPGAGDQHGHPEAVGLEERELVGIGLGRWSRK